MFGSRFRSHPVRVLMPLALLAALAPAAVPQPPKPDAEAVERARTAGRALAGELMAKLLAELESGGTAAALRVCSEVAQEVAASHSSEGLRVRRVSLRVRNPADRPDAWEETQLRRLEGLQREGELPADVVEVTEGGDGPELRYLKPIVVQAGCLRCHGDPETFEPGVREVLAERYPTDEATGYQAGDLRGAVSVRISLERPEGGS